MRYCTFTLSILCCSQNYGQKTAESKTMMVDSEVQTHLHSPSPPVSPVATAKSVSTNSHHSSHPSSPLPTPSHPHKQDANQQTATSGSLTTLSSFFSGQSLQKSLDEEILQACNAWAYIYMYMNH